MLDCFTRPSEKGKDGLESMFPPFSVNYFAEAPNRRDNLFSLLPRLHCMRRGHSHPRSVCSLKRQAKTFCYTLTVYLVRLHRYKSLPSEAVASANLAFTPNCSSIPRRRALSLRPAGKRIRHHSGTFATHRRGFTRLLARAGRIGGCNLT